MKRPAHGGLKAELNVTPLVDVVLVLLIIFMVVTPFLQKGRAVDLPRARASEVNKSHSHAIFLTLTAEKKLLLDRTEVAQAELVNVLTPILAQDPNVEVLIKGDRSLRYGDVRALMKACHQAGARRVGLATRDPGKEG
ncbi:MAG: biopolymer transporter ExbD [Myxococcota bacterium]